MSSPFHNTTDAIAIVHVYSTFSKTRPIADALTRSSGTRKSAAIHRG
jgi:hypothetical protein